MSKSHEFKMKTVQAPKAANDLISYGKVFSLHLAGLLAALGAGHRRVVLGNPGSWLRLAGTSLPRGPSSGLILVLLFCWLPLFPLLGVGILPQEHGPSFPATPPAPFPRGGASFKMKVQMSSQDFQMLVLHLQFLLLPPAPMWPLPSLQPPLLESMRKNRNEPRDHSRTYQIWALLT